MIPKITHPFSVDTIKLATFDLDGTIVGANGIISPRTITAIHNLRARGILIAVATGRAWFGAQTFAEQINANGPCVSFSGALIYDIVNQKPSYERCLEIPTIEEFLSRARDFNVYCELYTIDDYYITKRCEFTEVHAYYLKREAKPEDLLKIARNEPIFKIGIIAEFERAREIKEGLNGVPNGVLTLANVSAHPNILLGNLTHTLASRDACFDILCSQLGIQEEGIIAFGDAEADISFIRRAGIGVAMANASKEVQNVADITAPSIEEDGVATIIEQLLG